MIDQDLLDMARSKLQQASTYKFIIEKGVLVAKGLFFAFGFQPGDKFWANRDPGENCVSIGIYRNGVSVVEVIVVDDAVD